MTRGLEIGEEKAAVYRSIQCWPHRLFPEFKESLQREHSNGNLLSLRSASVLPVQAANNIISNEWIVFLSSHPLYNTLAMVSYALLALMNAWEPPCLNSPITLVLTLIIVIVKSALLAAKLDYSLLRHLCLRFSFAYIAIQILATIIFGSYSRGLARGSWLSASFTVYSIFIALSFTFLDACTGYSDKEKVALAAASFLWFIIVIVRDFAGYSDYDVVPICFFHLCSDHRKVVFSGLLQFITFSVRFLVISLWGLRNSGRAPCQFLRLPMNAKFHIDDPDRHVLNELDAPVMVPIGDVAVIGIPGHLRYQQHPPPQQTSPFTRIRVMKTSLVDGMLQGPEGVIASADVPFRPVVPWKWAKWLGSKKVYMAALIISAVASSTMVTLRPQQEFFLFIIPLVLFFTLIELTRFDRTLLCLLFAQFELWFLLFHLAIHMTAAIYSQHTLPSIEVASAFMALLSPTLASFSFDVAPGYPPMLKIAVLGCLLFNFGRVSVVNAVFHGSYQPYTFNIWNWTMDTRSIAFSSFLQMVIWQAKYLISTFLYRERFAILNVLVYVRTISK